MDVSVVFAYVAAITLAAGFYFYRWWKNRKANPPPPRDDLGHALYKLNSGITAFALKTIHPRELLASPDFQKAVALLGESDIDTLRQYATAANPKLAGAAFEAMTRHPARQEAFDAVIVRITHLSPEAMHFALRYFSSLEERPPVGGPAVIAQAWWADSVSLCESFKDYFGQRRTLGDTVDFGTYLEWGACQPVVQIQNFLGRINDPTALTLSGLLRGWSENRVNRKFLGSFGRFGLQAADETLVELAPWTANLDLAEKAVLAKPARPVLVSGAPRIGKTSFLKLLAGRLADEGWQVFEAGAADLMAGQSYFGELEGRVRQTVAELDSSKRVAWYVGDILQFAESGTHKGQSSSLLDQILPAVLDGRLVILAETSPEGLNRLLQTRPSLRTQMEIFKLQPLTAEEIAHLGHEAADALAIRAGILVPDDAVTTALQMSQQYLGAQPGMVVDLIKRAVQHGAAAHEDEVTPHDVMSALSQITGLPVAILDDKERVDLTRVRQFFAERVIGQDEAVSAIVDRIAMLKAGLVDPGRPVGVFLFAGPTGTGKTELAKTLAAYLFGSDGRMTRLDMSEFQHPDSIAKIVGERGYSTTSDPLVERVRKQPFSVVLLDEFEKAHPNVWDLFLQIFDDGQLADANGRVADFRHTIVILTSNLGATDHSTGAIGFQRSKDSYGESQVLAAVARTFRPEFVNRLDKIVVFKPLSRELMRQILNKELHQVLERRGLRNRDWLVEWEQSALEFLLDKGFSPEMGARPLKRAIDQYLLAPLAATLVERRFPEGDQFLFVRSDGKAIEVEFVDPHAPPASAEVESEAKPEPPEKSLAAMILQPHGLAEERDALDGDFSGVAARLARTEWHEVKAQAQAQAARDDIWSDPRRHEIFARVTLFDRVHEAMRTAERLKQRLDSGRAPSRELIQRLALQLHLVGAGADDVMMQAPIDAVIAIEPVLDGGTDNSGAAQQWCRRLAQMYRGWARLRHMQTGDVAGGELILIPVSGFGAWRTLAAEAGLHVLEEDSRRLTARVSVAAGASEDPRPDDAYRIYSQIIARTAKSTSVVRRYREHPSPLVRDAAGAWRTGRLDLVLEGNFDLIGSVAAKG